MLQIGTHMLLILTSTGDEFYRGTNTDDLERPWASKKGYNIFFAILGCNTHFKSELRQHGWK